MEAGKGQYEASRGGYQKHMTLAGICDPVTTILPLHQERLIVM